MSSFPHIQAFSTKQWLGLCADTEKILSYIQTRGIGLQSDHLSGKMIDVESGFINFNGDYSGRGETFYITREKIFEINSCNAHYKPYAVVVDSVLLLAYHWAPLAFKLNMGFDTEVVEKAAVLNASVLGHAYRFPENMKNINNDLIDVELKCEKIAVQTNIRLESQWLQGKVSEAAVKESSTLTQFPSGKNAKAPKATKTFKI